MIMRGEYVRDVQGTLSKQFVGGLVMQQGSEGQVKEEWIFGVTQGHAAARVPGESVR